MKTYYDILKSLGACKTALDARKTATVEQAMDSAERGDWILWLASRLKLSHRKITLAKARCARTVIHLMTDDRSKNAVEVAERYGNNEATEQELAAAYDAAAAYDTAAAYDAAAAAAAAAAADAYVAYVADTTAAAYAAADAARRENLRQTARICVEILGKDIIEAVNKLLSNN